MFNIMIQDTVINDKNNSHRICAQNIREKEIQKIKKLIKAGYEITFSKTNNWIRINGTTFNGYKREMIEMMIEEVNNE